MGSGFLKKKKQAKLFQEQFSEISKKLESIEASGESGNGLVQITLTGANEMKKITINPDCVDKDDIEGLETLIKAAYKDASEKLQNLTQNGSAHGLPDLSMFGF